jgi:hypothetical protein
MPLTQVKGSVLTSLNVGPTPSYSGAPRFLGIKDHKASVIDSDLFTYKAFPYFFVGSTNQSIIGWSSGEGHANSDEILYGIVNDETQEIEEEGVFYNLNTATESLGWLERFLPNDGDYLNFRSVYSVIRESGTLNFYLNSSIEVSDDTYSLWGTPFQYNGDWYTTAYRTAGSPSYFRPCLLKSTDSMKTWSFVALIASNSARTYNETAVLPVGGTNFIAITREDTQPGRDLYYTTSADAGVTWSPTPGTLLTPITGDVKGTQPSLTLLDNGDVLLVAGKRTGSSGIEIGGSLTDNEDITGIMYWTSSDDGATWSAGVSLAPSWSTDCGGPSVRKLSNGNVACVFYTALGATNGTVGVEPSIIYSEFDPSNTESS